MTGTITYFKAEDFEQKGIFNQFHSECQLGDVHFRKSDIFKHQEIQQVLDICKKHNSSGTNTLIVKDESNLTIWIELTSPSQAASAVNNNTHKTGGQNFSTGTQTSLPTKTVTKRYRGQIYEETVIDWAAVAMQKQGSQSDNKVRRKYRGNYIN